MQRKNQRNERNDTLKECLFGVTAVTMLPAFLLYQPVFQYHGALFLGTIGIGAITLLALALTEK